MSDSDSDFDGYGPQINTTVHDSDDDSDIVFSDVGSDDLSDSDDSEHEVGGAGDGGGGQQFSAQLHDVDILPFFEATGPRHSLSSVPMPSELDFFMLLVTEEMWRGVVDETNRYAAQCQAARRARDVAWCETTVAEMKAYIAINILIGINDVPQLDHYWSADDKVGCSFIQRIMAKSRFKKLNQYFHLNDNDTAVARGEAGYSPLHKIQPLISSVSTAFSRRYRPGRDLSIDEAMVAFKGRSHMKQYLPSKPVKWGFKVWTLAEAETGYVCGFEVYTGRRANATRNGLGYDVVMQLTEAYQFERRHLFFDNFFTSVKLLRDLEERQTYACGTIRSNRAGLPLDVKKPARLQRGQSVKRQAGNLVAVVWRDNRDVRVVSTNVDPGDGYVERRVDRTRVPVACPKSIIAYTASMGGVDLADQQRAYYGFGRPSKKFWRCIAWYIFNTAVVNSWILYRRSLPHPLTHKQYKMTAFEFQVQFN